jgi:hypothetical protein
MAELSPHHVVDQSQSVGDLSPSDAPATTFNTTANLSGEIDSVAEVALKENGIHDSTLVRMEDLEEVSGRSDTDTSRADGSVTDDKQAESKPLKKFPAAKPVSFAKYSVPKVIAATVAVKGTDKGWFSFAPSFIQSTLTLFAVPTPSSSTSSLQQVGRPRLVAKTASSLLQQKTKAHKMVTPDPMQVWNKNRGRN